ncbi:hypothetical protein [Streptomyces kebangsaanensis]|uniref:hypothetical protein n=1 Tax=Streptomyces kebangsaanensis TaxID=864058 RepID=UPI00093ED4A4|nr:hypothetical protein [Streptomyces kebangsaanensis]
MRVKGARRLVATSAAILMAGGAAIGAVGTAAAAAPAVHTQVTTSRCFGDDWRCFDHGGFRFDHDFDHGGFRFHHRFDHGFDGGPVVIIVR